MARAPGPGRHVADISDTVTVKAFKFELEHPSCWQYPHSLPSC
jgi:hypothetical protein